MTAVFSSTVVVGLVDWTESLQANVAVALVTSGANFF
jgi:uridine phosphorylase